VAEGHADAKAIARRLRISFYTVRVHLSRIYCKLGLHKQTELTACVAARYGSISVKAHTMDSLSLIFLEFILSFTSVIQ